MKHKKRKILCIIFVLLLPFIAIIAKDNSTLEITDYIIENEKIPSAFDGFKIVQVSDLHNAEFGEDNQKLLKIVAEQSPDLIAITGDVVDSRHTDFDIAVSTAASLAKIAPTYYVSGNHESRLYGYYKLKWDLICNGVTVLENQKVSLERGDEKITLIGIEDPTFAHDDTPLYMTSRMALQNLATDGEYKVLLAHRPEVFKAYYVNHIDLVLTGHAHGGQFRLPLIGPIFAPQQGFFPEYSQGTYTEDDTTMIVSRGLGNSIFPFRINNRPEIVAVTLKSK